MLRDLKKEFLVPQLNKMTMTGLIKIEFSDTVGEQDLESLLGNFIRDGVLK